MAPESARDTAQPGWRGPNHQEREALGEGFRGTLADSSSILFARPIRWSNVRFRWSCQLRVAGSTGPVTPQNLRDYAADVFDVCQTRPT